MADHSRIDLEHPPRRPRRGPPPRLYVIAPRQSPVPWLRVRRLGEADRAALVAHLRGLAAMDRRPRLRGAPDDAAIETCCNGVDFRTAVIFGAIAGNTVIAAACGAPGATETDVAATEDAGYRQRGLGAMLVHQVLGTPTPLEGSAGAALLQLMRGLGGPVVGRTEAETAVA